MNKEKRSIVYVSLCAKSLTHYNANGFYGFECNECARNTCKKPAMSQLEFRVDCIFGTDDVKGATTQTAIHYHFVYS